MQRLELDACVSACRQWRATVAGPVCRTRGQGTDGAGHQMMGPGSADLIVPAMGTRTQELWVGWKVRALGRRFWQPTSRVKGRGKEVR